MIAQFSVGYTYVDSAQILLSFINSLSCFACRPSFQQTSVNDI